MLTFALVAVLLVLTVAGAEFVRSLCSRQLQATIVPVRHEVPVGAEAE